MNIATEECLDNDENASYLNQLCSAAGIEIDTMSSINEQLMCFNDRETWDEVAAEIENEYENVVLNNRLRKVKQMSITHYLRTDNDF